MDYAGFPVHRNVADASYWLNCLYLHDYSVQLARENLGDELLSFLVNFSAGWLDWLGWATIIDEDQGPGVEPPPLFSCFFLESANLDRNYFDWLSREDYSLWLAIYWLQAYSYWLNNFWLVSAALALLWPWQTTLFLWVPGGFPLGHFAGYNPLLDCCTSSWPVGEPAAVY